MKRTTREKRVATTAMTQLLRRWNRLKRHRCGHVLQSLSRWREIDHRCSCCVLMQRLSPLLSYERWDLNACPSRRCMRPAATSMVVTTWVTCTTSASRYVVPTLQLAFMSMRMARECTCVLVSAWPV